MCGIGTDVCVSAWWKKKHQRTDAWGYLYWYMLVDIYKTVLYLYSDLLFGKWDLWVINGIVLDLALVKDLDVYHACGSIFEYGIKYGEGKCEVIYDKEELLGSIDR